MPMRNRQALCSLHDGSISVDAGFVASSSTHYGGKMAYRPFNTGKDVRERQATRDTLNEERIAKLYLIGRVDTCGAVLKKA